MVVYVYIYICIFRMYSYIHAYTTYRMVVFGSLALSRRGRVAFGQIEFCNHCNCDRKLFQNLYFRLSKFARFAKQNVFKICWSYELFVQTEADTGDVC